MKPSSERWQRLQTVFQHALALSPDERSAFLDKACRDAAFLRGEVEAMLDAQAPECALAIERMVDDRRSVTFDPASVGLPEQADPFIGTRLGAWRVVELLGRGGMGTVYLAERADGRYEQQVALKLVGSAATAGPALARYQAECRILARLSHANIARLLDAGFTPEGSAYLVMEYVDGCPITTYCDERQLTVDERLALFRVVCAATQHAHQSLVVHRDLKPSNIFVSRTGEVKLLDFGIAKLLEPDGTPADATGTELGALTPSYAAPEQLRGAPVTTATDVYVLGLVLYELLSGRRPFARAPHVDMTNGSAGIEAEPEAPSRAVRRAAPPGEAPRRDGHDNVARRHSTSLARLARRLSGDIDRVVLTAIKPEPERRYASAGQLAEEIDRLLKGRPVIAQPDTLAYRVRRFVARHRISVAVGAAVVALIAAFGVTAGVQARAAAIERDRARIEAARARRVSILLADIFRLAEPRAGQGDTIIASELLDRGTERIAAGLTDDARTQAELYGVLGRLYGNLALHDRAIAVLERAWTLQQSLREPEGSGMAETLDLLGGQLVRKNAYPAAISRFREALSLKRRLGSSPTQIAETLEGLGRALSFTGRHEEAEAVLREAVQIRRHLRDRSAAETMSGLRELALTLHRQGDLRNAEALFREAADVGRRVPRGTAAKVTAQLQLARVVHHFDRDAGRAEPIYRAALREARALYPEDHPDVAACLGELASDIRDLGRLAAAESLARQALAMLRRLYGNRHREVMMASQTLAGIVSQQGKTREAESLAREALATAGVLFGKAHPMKLRAERALATILEERRNYDEARALRERELAAAVEALGATNVYVAVALSGLGEHYLTTGNTATAEVYFKRALALRERLHGSRDPRVEHARTRLAAAQASDTREVGTPPLERARHLTYDRLLPDRSHARY